MNSISLSEFIAELPFASPGMWIEVICRAMAERFISGAPESTEEFIFDHHDHLRHPGEALEILWQTLCDDLDRIFDTSDFTSEAMLSMGIRLLDPVRWGEREGVSLIAPRRLAGSGYAEEECYVWIRHRNSGATRSGYETVGGDKIFGVRFSPGCDLQIILQIARILNASNYRFLLPHRGSFTVPGTTNRVGVRLFFVKINRQSRETTGFGTLFNGTLAPGSYSLDNEALFPAPGVTDAENIYYAGYLDIASGGNLRYLY